mgnify:CR=1 FL=1
MSDPVEVTGDLNMFVQLHGTLKDPEGNGSVEVKNGSMAGIGFDDFTAMLSLANDNLKIEQAMLNKDIYKASAMVMYRWIYSDQKNSGAILTRR